MEKLVKTIIPVTKMGAVLLVSYSLTHAIMGPGWDFKIVSSRY